MMLCPGPATSASPLSPHHLTTVDGKPIEMDSQYSSGPPQSLRAAVKDFYATSWSDTRGIRGFLEQILAGPR